MDPARRMRYVDVVRIAGLQLDIAWESPAQNHAKDQPDGRADLQKLPRLPGYRMGIDAQHRKQDVRHEEERANGLYQQDE